MRARVGIVLLYVVAIAVALGGVGDLSLRGPLDVHRAYVGGEMSDRTASLLLHLFHALGGCLVGVGLASLALVHFALRRGQRWAAFAVLAAIVPAETANAIGMYAVSSFYYVSLTYLGMAVAGVALVLTGPSARRGPWNGPPRSAGTTRE